MGDVSPTPNETRVMPPSLRGRLDVLRAAQAAVPAQQQAGTDEGALLPFAMVENFLTAHPIFVHQPRKKAANEGGDDRTFSARALHASIVEYHKRFFLPSSASSSATTTPPSTAVSSSSLSTVDELQQVAFADRGGGEARPGASLGGGALPRVRREGRRHHRLRAGGGGLQPMRGGGARAAQLPVGPSLLGRCGPFDLPSKAGPRHQPAERGAAVDGGQVQRLLGAQGQEPTREGGAAAVEPVRQPRPVPAEGDGGEGSRLEERLVRLLAEGGGGADPHSAEGPLPRREDGEERRPQGAGGELDHPLRAGGGVSVRRMRRRLQHEEGGVDALRNAQGAGRQVRGLETEGVWILSVVVTVAVPV